MVLDRPRMTGDKVKESLSFSTLYGVVLLYSTTGRRRGREQNIPSMTF